MTLANNWRPLVGTQLLVLITGITNPAFAGASCDRTCVITGSHSLDAIVILDEKNGQ